MTKRQIQQVHSQAAYYYGQGRLWVTTPAQAEVPGPGYRRIAFDAGEAFQRGGTDSGEARYHHLPSSVWALVLAEAERERAVRF